MTQQSSPSAFAPPYLDEARRYRAQGGYRAELVDYLHRCGVDAGQAEHLADRFDLELGLAGHPRPHDVTPSVARQLDAHWELLASTAQVPEPVEEAPPMRSAIDIARDASHRHATGTADIGQAATLDEALGGPVPPTVDALLAMGTTAARAEAEVPTVAPLQALDLAANSAPQEEAGHAHGGHAGYPQAGQPGPSDSHVGYPQAEQQEDLGPRFEVPVAGQAIQTAAGEAVQAAAGEAVQAAAAPASAPVAPIDFAAPAPIADLASQPHPQAEVLHPSAPIASAHLEPSAGEPALAPGALQAPTAQAPGPLAHAPQTPAPAPVAPTPQAAVPQAPAPQAAVPQAPAPQAAVPQAPTPQAAVPQAAVPQAPVPPAPVPPTAAEHMPAPYAPADPAAAAPVAPAAPIEFPPPAPAAPVVAQPTPASATTPSMPEAAQPVASQPAASSTPAVDPIETHEHRAAGNSLSLANAIANSASPGVNQPATLAPEAPASEAASAPASEPASNWQETTEFGYAIAQSWDEDDPNVAINEASTMAREGKTQEQIIEYLLSCQVSQDEAKYVAQMTGARSVPKAKVNEDGTPVTTARPKRTGRIKAIVVLTFVAGGLMMFLGWSAWNEGVESARSPLSLAAVGAALVIGGLWVAVRRR